MTRAPRLIAFVAVAAMVLASCAKLGTSSSNVQPADIYAAVPTLSDVKVLLGDNNWWQAPPSFGVRPMDAATVPLTERFSLTQEYIHVGTAEFWVLNYAVYDKTSSATTRMTDLQNAFGPSPSSPKAGDQVLYYGVASSGAAPYELRTFVRVSQIVATIVWTKKDLSLTLQQLGRNAAKVVDGLKKALGGKLHSSIQPVDPKLLPPLGLDITFLGSTQLPVESWVVMVLASIALPDAAVQVLRNAGVTNFAYGDYALNNDTHMEVRTALITFSSPAVATQWATTFAPGAPDANGIANAYIQVGGSPAAGEYHYLFVSGAYGGLLVCKPSLDGEAASRECESPLERTAVAWKIALGG